MVIKRSVRVLISAKGRQYRKDVGSLILANRPAGTPFSGRLAVHIDAFPPDRRKRDIDNLHKATLDALTHAGVWNDDEQIDDLRTTRHAVGEGMIHVTITELQ